MTKDCIKCGAAFEPLQHNQKQCSCCYMDELARRQMWKRLDKFIDRVSGFTEKKCTRCETTFTPTSPQHRICADCQLKKKKDRHLVTTFGISHAMYDELLELQNNRCAICCTDTPSQGRGSVYFNVDHDHKTGAVRGLLCTKCNVGLGHFKDNVDVMAKAVEYLMLHRKSNDHPSGE